MYDEENRNNPIIGGADPDQGVPEEQTGFIMRNPDVQQTDEINGTNEAGSESYGSYTFNNTSENQQDNSIPENSTYVGPQINYSSTNTQNTPRKPKKKNSIWKWAGKCVAAGLVFGIVAGVGFQATNGFKNWFDPESPSVTETKTEDTSSKVNTTQTSSVTSTVTDVSNVVEQVMPSVVSITNVETQTINDVFGRGTYEQEAEGAGSGFIIGKTDTELQILTNYHVITGADKLSVKFIDDTTVEAQIKGSDSQTDLAVVAVPISSLTNETLDKIAVATLGDSTSLKIGEPVIAIGNALGYGQSVTTGIVSAVDREVAVEENTTHKMIQTDAAINPGNSGGALLNIRGEVIGVNEMKNVSTQTGVTIEGMGYAIPISTAMSTIEDLLSRDTKSKVDDAQVGYLGITGRDVTSDLAKTYNLPTGIFISEVEQGSPAEKAGIASGDIITSFDGNTVTSLSELQKELQYYAAGTKIEMKILKSSDGGYGYKEQTITVELGARPSSVQQ